MPRLLAILLFASLCGAVCAHTVPVTVVEAEFGARREATLKVNLDPRLFMSSQPTSLPPVPASWWFEQDDAAKEKSKRDAADYVQRTLEFRVGATVWKGGWQVQPIDSASAFPLGRASAEVHLLAEHRGPLPEASGDFKMAIAKDCAVAVILLCSNAGDPERRPQSLFPGETSRSFALPALPQAANSATASGGHGNTGQLLARLTWLASHSHFAWDHAALALLLGLTLRLRLRRAVAALAVFHAVDLTASSLVMVGWLPAAPPWMTLAYWAAVVLAILHLLVLRSKASALLATIAAAGLCHGLNLPHLRLEAGAETAATLMLLQNGALLLAELSVLSLCRVIAGAVMRRSAQASCSTTA